MISWKIWAIHRKLPGPAVAGIRVMGVIAVIIESGESSIHATLTVFESRWGGVCSGSLLLCSRRTHCDKYLAHERAVDYIRFSTFTPRHPSS